MTTLERISAIRAQIQRCEDAIQKIQAECQHEWVEELVHQLQPSVYVIWRTRCTKCDARSRVRRVPLEWYRNYEMRGLVS